MTPSGNPRQLARSPGSRKYPGHVTSNESWRKYLEAGAAVGQATAARAEDIARRLFEGDDEERDDAWRDLEQLTRFGRLMGEQLAEMARTELSRQLRSAGGRSLDQLFDRIADLFAAPETPEAVRPETEEPLLEAGVVVVAGGPETTGPPEGQAQKNKLAEASRNKGPKKNKKDKKNKRNKKEKRKERAKGEATRTSAAKDGAMAGPGSVRLVVPPPDPAGGS